MSSFDRLIDRAEQRVTRVTVSTVHGGATLFDEQGNRVMTVYGTWFLEMGQVMRLVEGWKHYPINHWATEYLKPGTRVPFEVLEDRAEDHLFHDILEAEREIAQAGADWWDLQKRNRWLAFNHLFLCCCNFRELPGYWMGEGDRRHFFALLDAQELDLQGSTR